jgi:hypothetical protein
MKACLLKPCNKDPVPAEVTKWKRTPHYCSKPAKLRRQDETAQAIGIRHGATSILRGLHAANRPEAHPSRSLHLLEKNARENTKMGFAPFEPRAAAGYVAIENGAEKLLARVR